MIVSSDHIKKVITEYFKNKPVNKIWLFGSYARGEALDSSDIDLLVDIEHDAKIGMSYYSWNEELQELLNKKVDVVSKGWENKHIRPFIEKDKVVVYEK